MEQHCDLYFLRNYETGLEWSVLPPLGSRKHTRAKRLITATNSAPDRSQDGAFSRSGPTAISQKRNATSVPQINIKTVLLKEVQPYLAEDEQPMTDLQIG